MSKGTSRREFIVRLGQIGALAAVGGTLWGGFVSQEKAQAFTIKPPGAKPHQDFLASCIKCGQCVDACPFDTLSLTAPGQKGELGVPSFNARKVPCYMCADVPCARACPTGALKKDIKIEDSKMGLAVLLDQENCIAFQGLRCEVCYRVCPLMDKAISLNYRPQERTGKHAYFEPVVHSDACTGCGMCEHACILEESAIRVLPLELAQGKMGKNYRLGWIDQGKIGDGQPLAPAKGAPQSPEKSGSNLKNALETLGNSGSLYD